MRPALPLLIAALLLSAGASAQQPAEPSFAPEHVRAHIAFLADDLLEGRNAGTRGYDIAAAYIASRFEALGLTPAGPDASWYQMVGMREAHGAGTRRITLIGPGGERSWNNGDDVIVGPSLFETEQAIEAPLVFVGYGIDRADLGVDDYAGLDVTGAIVVTLAGFPRGMASEIGAHLNAEKNVMAEARGAIGRIAISTDASEAVFPWERQIEYANLPSTTWMQADRTPFSRTPNLRAGATLNRPAAEALFEGAPTSLADIRAEAAREGGRPRGFALDRSARIERSATFRAYDSANVVAILPGSDPALANEYVLMTAHLDHDGIREGEGDQLFNGAMDNAAGVATMLEVARALAESPTRPRRPILFVALTAEEDGLLGADYLARHPLTRDGRAVAVVNFDMPLLTYDFTDVIAFGAENSTLGPLVAEAAGRIGVTLSPDPTPEEGTFTRSDHYRFVQQGVPAVFLATGYAGPGEAAWTDFLANHYHRPSDDLALPIDWGAAAKFARVNYYIARAIADADQAPRWYERNFFGDTFAPDTPRAPAP